MSNNEVLRLSKMLAKAEADSAKASARRAALPPGSSRAKVTTANAKWAIKAEQRDRLREQLCAAIAADRDRADDPDLLDAQALVAEHASRR